MGSPSGVAYICPDSPGRENTVRGEKEFSIFNKCLIFKNIYNYEKGFGAPVFPEIPKEGARPVSQGRNGGQRRA